MSEIERKGEELVCAFTEYFERCGVDLEEFVESLSEPEVLE